MSATAPASTTAFDRRLLAPMMLGSILNPVNSSIIAVALVPIAAVFGAPASQTAWLVSGLYLATSIGQPLMGRLIDLFGPRRLFLVGAVLTVIAGVVGTVAPNLWVLVVARVILGFGTCAAYPASMFLIRSEATRTGVASPAGVLTALAVTTQTVSVIGPTLGGALIGAAGWRATIAINVPLGILTLILGALFLPSPTSGPESTGDRRIDAPGIALFAVTVLCWLLFLMNLSLTYAWLPVVGVVTGVAFVIRERRVDTPFIDIGVVAGNRPLVLTYFRAVLAATVSYCYLYGFTQWLQEARGLSATTVGLVLLPTFVVGIAVSTLTGRRPQIRRKLLVGGTVQLLIAAVIIVVPGGAPIWLLVAIAAVNGLPQGLLNLAVQNSVFYQADPERIGASAGLQRTFLYTGAMLAASATGVFFGARATLTGVHELGIFMAVVAAVLTLITVGDRSLRQVDRRAAESTDHAVSQ